MVDRIAPSDLRKPTKADRAREDFDFILHMPAGGPIRCFRAAAEGMPCDVASMPVIAARHALALAVARHLASRRAPA